MLKYEEIKAMQAQGLRTVEMIESAMKIGETSLAFLLADKADMEDEIEEGLFTRIQNDGYVGKMRVSFKRLAGSEFLARAISATGDMSQYVQEGELFCTDADYYESVYKDQEWIDWMSSL
jgi:hypothetical protein